MVGEIIVPYGTETSSQSLNYIEWSYDYEISFS